MSLKVPQKDYLKRAHSVEVRITCVVYVISDQSSDHLLRVIVDLTVHYPHWL